MGAAVSDAAAWYDKADWIGIAATPHATMSIQSLLELHNKNYDYILVDYAVPLRGGAKASVKAVNWPKAFYVKGLRPNLPGGARSMLLSFLAHHNVPLGTESKYFNSVAFFDYVKREQDLGKRSSKGLVADPKA